MIYIPEYVKNLNPYRAGNEQKSNLKIPIDEIINLASNENLLGPSPKAIEYIKKGLEKANFYPDPGSSELVNVISKKIGRDTNQIICGHGSESLIGHILNSFSDIGDEIITASGTFVGIFVITNKLGRKLTTVPLKNYSFDLEGILNAINEKTRAVYLSNPNNPTGTMFGKDTFKFFLKNVPENVLIIYDEAYSYYAQLYKDYPNGLDYEQSNLIILRTLSKIYGLAGVRIGFGIGPAELIKIVYKVKYPFEPSVLAQYAAMGALEDDEYVAKTLKLNKLSLTMITEKLKELDIEYLPGYANFVMAIFQEESFAHQFSQMCADRGVLVRHTKSFGVPDGVRISSGTLKQTEIATKIFETVYSELSLKIPVNQ
jgi:histidinol-phosphate aminotransferase